MRSARSLKTPLEWLFSRVAAPVAAMSNPFDSAPRSDERRATTDQEIAPAAEIRAYLARHGGPSEPAPAVTPVVAEPTPASYSPGRERRQSRTGATVVNRRRVRSSSVVVEDAATELPIVVDAAAATAPVAVEPAEPAAPESASTNLFEPEPAISEPEQVTPEPELIVAQSEPIAAEPEVSRRFSAPSSNRRFPTRLRPLRLLHLNSPHHQHRPTPTASMSYRSV